MWTFESIHLEVMTYQWGVVIGASLVGAACDLSSRRIPNWLTLPTLMVGLIVSCWVGGLTGLGDSVGGCILMAAPYVILFVFAGGGAGDAKLMGAVGAWLGLSLGVVVLLCVAVVGAVLGIAASLVHKEGRGVVANLWGFTYVMTAVTLGQMKWSAATQIVPHTESMRKMPYGAAIFLGVCVAAMTDYFWLS